MKPSQSPSKAAAPRSFLLPLVAFAFLFLVPRKDKLTLCHNRISVCLLECSVNGITWYIPLCDPTSFTQPHFSEIGPRCSVCATAFEVVSQLLDAGCFWCSSVALHFSLGSFLLACLQAHWLFPWLFSLLMNLSKSFKISVPVFFISDVLFWLFP